MREGGWISPRHWLILADLFADLGNQSIQLALMDVLVFQGRSALTCLLLMSIVEQVPGILVSPIAGRWIERMGPGRCLTWTNIGKGVLPVLLVLSLSPWVAFPVYLCLLTGSVFFYIGRLSLTPMLNSRDELLGFNALNERVSLAGRILGPCVIGWIIVKTAPAWVLGLSGLFFAFSSGLTARLPKFAHTGDKPLSKAQRGHHGFKFLISTYRRPLRENQILKSYFIIFGFVLFSGGILNLGLPIFFKTHLGTSIADWGLILSGFQAGSWLATLLVGPCASALGARNVVFVAFVVLAGSMAVLGRLTTSVQIALLMMLYGCCFSSMHILLESLIQKHSPKDALSKVMSLLATYRGACYLTTVLSGAVVLEIWGPRSLLLTGSVFMAAASFFARR